MDSPTGLSVFKKKYFLGKKSNDHIHGFGTYGVGLQIASASTFHLRKRDLLKSKRDFVLVGVCLKLLIQERKLFV